MNKFLVQFDKKMYRGILLRRYKRFLADVTLKETGEKVTLHVPNTGSMMTCSDPGSEVIVSESENPDRKLPFTLELVRVSAGEYGWAGVNTYLPNITVSKAISAGLIPELSGYTTLKREVSVAERTRLDIVLENDRNEKCYIEVKNVTLGRTGIASFPDAVTERGRKHLEVLAELKRIWARTVIFFLVQRPDCERFTPADDIDPAYGKILRKVLKEGVEILVYRTLSSIRGISLDRRLPFVLDNNLFK